MVLGSEFSNTFWGVVLGGFIAIVGQFISQWLQGRQDRKQRKEDFQEQNLAELQEQLVQLVRDVDDVWDHRTDEAWQPARFDGVKVRIRYLTARIADGELDRLIDRVLKTADAASRRPSKDHEDKKACGDAVADAVERTALLLRQVH